MIKSTDSEIAWALLVQGLDDAREHLETLVSQMVRDGEIEDEDFAVQLGHVYAHLNRAWHSRNEPRELTDAEWEQATKLPVDVFIVG